MNKISDSLKLLSIEGGDASSFVFTFQISMSLFASSNTKVFDKLLGKARLGSGLFSMNILVSRQGNQSTLTRTGLGIHPSTV